MIIKKREFSEIFQLRTEIGNQIHNKIETIKTKNKISDMTLKIAHNFHDLSPIFSSRVAGITLKI